MVRGRQMEELFPIHVAIIDYEMSNLFSVKHACECVGMIPVITTEKEAIKNAHAIILPGVGAFGEAMKNLRKLDLVAPILDYIAAGKLFMGICLGMQLLMTESEEHGVHQGLNVIKGSVIKFPHGEIEGRKCKVPHMGWNHIRKPRDASDSHWAGTPLQGLRDDEFMYFVHSFYVKPDSADNILSETDYSIKYASSIMRNNIYGFQFHPEKSGKYGIEIYRNFKELILGGRLYDRAKRHNKNV